MNINGVELDFDIFDASVAKRYETALETLNTLPKSDEGQTLSDSILAQCDAVFSFFDILFGPGTAEKLFDHRKNLKECLDATEQVVLTVNQQQKQLTDRVACYRASQAAQS